MSSNGKSFITLAKGATKEGVGFTHVAAAVLCHCWSVGAGYVVLDRSGTSMKLVCSVSKDCPFQCRARLAGTAVKITEFVGHNCLGPCTRQRAYKTAVLCEITNIIGNYQVPAAGACKQLGDMLQEELSVTLKKGQLYNIIKEKGITIEKHLAQCRLIKSYMAALAVNDAEGVYKVETILAQDDSEVAVPHQLRRIFCAPGGSIKTFHHFDGMVCVDAAHLRSAAKGYLCFLTTYDANRQLVILAFGIMPVESADNWDWFLSQVKESFPTVRMLMSDGAKGLESADVQTSLSEWGVPHTRCMYHILQKNAVANKQLKMTPEQKSLLQKAVYACSKNLADFYLSKVQQQNPKLHEWFCHRRTKCLTHLLLREPNQHRLGVVTSNSCEQANAAIGEIRSLPICNLVAATLKYMADKRIGKATKATECFESGNVLTPRCLQDMTSCVENCGKLNVEVNTVHGSAINASVMLAKNPAVSETVTVTSDFAMTCTCNAPWEYKRPCRHVAAVLRKAPMLLNNVQPGVFDVLNIGWYDKAWHTTTWMEQHGKKSIDIKRARVMRNDLVEEELAPMRIVGKPGRKRRKTNNGARSSSAKTGVRICPGCGQRGHFLQACPKPMPMVLVEKKRKKVDKIMPKVIDELAGSLPDY